MYVLFRQTIHERHPLAPGHYNAEKVQLDHTPAFSFGLKLNQGKTSDTPGTICISHNRMFNKFHILAPGYYNAEKVQLDHTPAYSFGVKINHEKVSSTPGMFNQFNFYGENLLTYHFKKHLEHMNLKRFA